VRAVPHEPKTRGADPRVLRPGESGALWLIPAAPLLPLGDDGGLALISTGPRPDDWGLGPRVFLRPPEEPEASARGP